MEKYKVEISEPAENDLRDIIRYISAQLNAPISAGKMLEAIEDALMKLPEIPHGYQLVREDRLASLGYRCVNIKNYAVFYSINEKKKEVYIERILYARRDWANLI